jgi:hypothetical protein
MKKSQIIINSTKSIKKIELGSTFEQGTKTFIPDDFFQHTKGVAIRPVIKCRLDFNRDDLF